MKFLNIQIDTSKKVFIPRIETEFWVGKALEVIKKLKGGQKDLEGLDVFTGTGCIGIAVLKSLDNLKRMDFVDIDKAALSQVKINLRLNQISKGKYRIIQSNVFEKVEGKYDLIFANPPYVACERIFEVQPWILKEEPHQALFGGKRGMDYLKEFIDNLTHHLKAQGMAFFEFDPSQKEEIEDLLKMNCLNFQLRKDQFAKWRWGIIINNNS